MPAPIRVAAGPSGSLTYAVPVPPERLPAVSPGALLSAWALARRAAEAEQWGPPRLLVFECPEADGTDPPTEIAIADPDAGAWAEAIDAAVGLESLGGMALCLRLLALVEVLAREPALRPLYALGRDGIELHPRLVRAAAAQPLDAGARFDAAGFRGLLLRPTLPG
jgi:hypothetical protein